MTGSPQHPSGAPEERALATLLAQRPAFHGFLTKRLQDSALADDLLQDAYGKAIGRLSSLRDGEAVVAWFYQLLRNVVVDHQRAAKTRSHALQALARDLGEKPSEDPHSPLAKTCACVTRLVGDLDPRYAQALRRIEIDGAPVKTFADESGITANNAAVRVFRARAALRRDVEETCGACSANGCADCDCEDAPKSP